MFKLFSIQIFYWKELLKQLKTKQLGTQGASFLGNFLTGKGIVKAGSRNTKEKWIVRAGYGN